MKETLPQVQTENQKYADISAYSRKDLKKKKKMTLLMDFQEELKIQRVTDSWKKKVLHRLKVLSPFREGRMTEEHAFFQTR